MSDTLVLMLSFAPLLHASHSIIFTSTVVSHVTCYYRSSSRLSSTDQYLFVSCSLKVFSVAGVLGVFILLPINFVGTQLNEDSSDLPNKSLDSFSISNVNDGSNRWLSAGLMKIMYFLIVKIKIVVTKEKYDMSWWKNILSGCYSFFLFLMMSCISLHHISQYYSGCAVFLFRCFQFYLLQNFYTSVDM